jgi:plasmid stabilization system protein ParE
MRCGPSMAYRVSLSAPAETDAYAAFDRIREAAPIHAEKWLTGLFEAIFSLDELPDRCPVIPEATELGYPVRHLLYGKGRGVYRIIFHISGEGQHVSVLRIWHASRDAITADDVKAQAFA